VELDRHYTFRVCSPSRCAFLTGRNPIHVNIDNGNCDRYNPADPVSGYQGVPLNMTMISNKLKPAGYSTHFVGKWDAGMTTTAHIPIRRGFDSGLGYFHHANDYWNENTGGIWYSPDPCAGGVDPIDLWDNDRPAYNLSNPKNCSEINQPHDCVYEDELFLRRVINVIEQHNPQNPLFLYWAPHNLHEPLQVPKEIERLFDFIDWEPRRLYAAMAYYLDTMIGQVVTSLKRKGLYENTLIVFSSDNGGAVYRNGTAGANNWPLRGGKVSNWEGGIRVNAFASGGVLPPNVRGTKLESLIGIFDWYATFCAIAGVDPFDAAAEKAGLPPVDSMDMWPVISGRNKTGPRNELILGGLDVQGIISNQYKLLMGSLPYDSWTGPFFPNATLWESDNSVLHCDSPCLFDIYADPTEHHDIASEHPTIVADLVNRINDAKKTIFNPDRGALDPAACNTALGKYNGFWGPWVNI